MSARSGMDTILENPMFFFVDDAEPILPIFRSTDYSGTGRIVELADVGCDTETTFPIHFPRGASDRRHGGADSLKSTRRIQAKWLNDKPNEFARRRATDGRNKNYVRRKTQRDDYDNMYIADLDYDDSYAESPYDDPELTRNDSGVEEEEDECYVHFVNLRNADPRSRTERIPRYDYSRDPESSFAQGIRVPQRESTSPRWYTESERENVRQMNGTSFQLDDRRKRTKILSRANKSFNLEEFGRTRKSGMQHERDDLPKTADSIASTKNAFWDFIPFENDAKCEEMTLDWKKSNPTRTKNHGGLQKMAPHRKRSYTFDSPKRVDTVDSEAEEEFKETLKKDRRENLSPENPKTSTQYRTLIGDMVKEKSKILRLNTSSAISSRNQLMKTPTDKGISNTYPAGKNPINVRTHSTPEGKKTKTQTIEKREEITNATVDDRDKFNKLPNNSPKETDRSRFNRVADSKNNGRMYTANERDNINPRGNSKNSKINRNNMATSRIAPEKKMTKNEKTFALKMTYASALRPDVEKKKERKFFSRLPIRTWKRLRTKEPAALRPENNATNGDNQKLQGMENETANESSDHSERVESDDVRVKDRAAANRTDVKRGKRYETGLRRTDKPGLTFSNLKSIKGIKGLNTARETHEQRKKRMGIK